MRDAGEHAAADAAGRIDPSLSSLPLSLSLRICYGLVLLLCNPEGITVFFSLIFFLYKR